MRTLFFILFAALFYSVTAQHVLFNHPFAPQQGLIPEIERPYREEICLNGSWQFMPVAVKKEISLEEIKNPVYPESPVWEKVAYKVPSPWNVNGFSEGGGGDFVAYPSYPESWKTAQAGWLQKTIRVPDSWNQSAIKLHFEAVAGYSQVYVNGHRVGENFDIFLPFTLDVTPYAVAGQELDIRLWVAHGNLLNDPGKYGRRNYVAGSFWGIHIVGIWQDVYLQKYPEVYIADTYVKPDVSGNQLTAEVTVRNTSPRKQTLSLGADIRTWINEADTSVIEFPVPSWHLDQNPALTLTNQTIEIAPGTSRTVSLQVAPDHKLTPWTPAHPALYGLSVVLNGKKQTIDTDYTRFGWRQFKTKGTHLYLNDELIELKGDSWHFMGVPQMTRRYAYSWFRMLKDAEANAVRLHAQVFPRFYMEMADEMGICILDETAIWSSDGGPKVDSELYWEACREHVRRLVLRDRNYPSVFGWSVCNETLPVTKHVFNAPQELVDKNVAEINKWVAIVREHDDTRNWISGDGETQARTDLPTVIGHYGDVNTMVEWKSQGKPWGIGETGMAYYGTPAQVAQENGDRAYESQKGRMEGLAAEAFRLIQTQRNLDASYACVFNLAWYGLQPLELGLSDTTRPVQSSDGIYFPPFQEGVPGVQPERLGAYTTTFNPGYDSRLPLYRTWPLFDAVKAAYGDNYAVTENQWAVRQSVHVTEPVSSLREVVWISSAPETTGRQPFDRLAIMFKLFNEKQNQLLLIDGTSPISNGKLIADIRQAMEAGSTVFVWNTTEAILPFLESLSGDKQTLTGRKSTSFIIRNKHAVLNGQNLSRLYFTELTKQPVSSYVLSCQGDGIPLLEPCNTDWGKWNYQGENIKTALVLRSEREKKPQGSVLYQKKIGSGELLVSTLNLSSLGNTGNTLLYEFLSNLGARFGEQTQRILTALDTNGNLVNAQSDAQQGGERTLSFWIFSPRSLTNLLAEPNMPRLDLEFATADGVAIYVNNILYTDGLMKQPTAAYPSRVNGLPLGKGWNHIQLKVAKKDDAWQGKFHFTSTDNRFMKQLETVVSRLYTP